MLLFLIILVLFGLFLQLDLSFRFTDSRGADSLLGFKLGIGGGRTSKYDLGRTGGRKVSGGDSADLAGKVIAGVSDAKIRWDDEGGALRSKVPAHAPGWTIFDNMYLFNGTWYLVTDHPSTIPLLRMMVSTGAEIWNDEDSIRRREPTEKDMRIIFPSEARRLWGDSASRVSGVTLLVNDPPQFLDHYYHYAAELLFGLWRTYSSLDPSINAAGQTQLSAPGRMIMPHVAAGKWNDYAKMNSFISRAVFPAMSYEYQSDFLDRADTQRAFIFDQVVFADRAAAFRGPEFAKTWRTASEAVTLGGSRYWWSPVRRNLLEFVGSGASEDDEDISFDDFGIGLEEADDELGVSALEEHVRGNLKDEPQFKRRARSALSRDEPVFDRDVKSGQGSKLAQRRAVGKAAAKNAARKDKPARKEHSPANPVITYVSRQDWGRRMLVKKDHDELVKELQALEKKYGWEVSNMTQITFDCYSH